MSIKTLYLPSQPLRREIFSPDGRWLIAHGPGQDTCLYRVDGELLLLQKLPFQLQLETEFAAFDYTNGRTEKLAILFLGAITVFTLAGRDFSYKVCSVGGAVNLCFSDKSLFVGGADGKLTCLEFDADSIKIKYERVVANCRIFLLAVSQSGTVAFLTDRGELYFGIDEDKTKQESDANGKGWNIKELWFHARLELLLIRNEIADQSIIIVASTDSSVAVNFVKKSANESIVGIQALGGEQVIIITRTRVLEVLLERSAQGKDGWLVNFRSLYLVPERKRIVTGLQNPDSKNIELKLLITSDSHL